MREIPPSFTYASQPSPSMMSRDPDGINLAEDYGAQLEPSGTMPDEHQVVTTMTPGGSTCIALNDFAEGERKIVLDMAKIIGLPPPPPPTTKPPMRRNVRRSKLQTPKSSSTENASGFESNETTVPQNTATRSPSSSPRGHDVIEQRLQLTESDNQSNVLVLDEQKKDGKSSQLPVSPSRQRSSTSDEPSSISTNPKDTSGSQNISQEVTFWEGAKVAPPSPKSKAKQEKRAKKRGFFKKIFGGGKNREPAPSVSDTTPSLPEKAVAIDPPIAPTSPVRQNDFSPKSLQQVEQQASPETLKSSLEEVTGQRSVVKNKFSFDTEENEDDSPINIEDSTTSIPQESSEQIQAFSLDPPDDGNGDPPENSGRPLVSPTSYRGTCMYMDTTINDEDEQMRLETVRSRIAEIYGDNNEQEAIEPTNVDVASPPDEHPHQEEDCLRVKTQESRSIEPVGASPIVHYKRAIQTGLASGDPVGETPKARATSRVLSNDPVGVSLCHESTTPKSSPEVALPSMDDEGEKDSIGAFEANGVEEKNEDGNDVVEKQDRASMTTPSDDSKAKQPNSSEAQLGEGPIDSDEILSQSVTDSTMKETTDLTPKLGKLSLLHGGKMKLDKDLESSKQRSRQAVEKDGLKHLASKEKLIEIQKAGFNAVSNTSTTDKNNLTVSAAAFTNAKAIAYLHRLEGETSPRHTYHSNYFIAPPLLDNPAALAKIRMFSAKKKKGRVERVATNKRPSPNEYSAANAKVKEELEGPPKKSYVTHDPKKQFAAYSRFQGRRPRKLNAEKQKQKSPAPGTVALTTSEPAETKPATDLQLVVASNKLAKLAIARGVQLRKTNPETTIGNKGLNRSIVSGNRFNFFPAHESEIKNPVQRAGRRLLSKSAVPIQASIRMFIAKNEALDRMWAIIQLQSNFRRWKCEADFRAQRATVILVQKVFRGHKVREELKIKNSCATSIQKIARGYLAALRAYETIYFVSRAQAVARGYLVRSSNARKSEAAKILQAFCLRSLRQKNYSATLIQKHYREYRLRQDKKRIQRARAIITVQSVARRWAACRAADLIRKSVYSYSITKFQAVWRGYSQRNQRQKTIAAKKIQHLCRRHLAKTHNKKVSAATKIQATWRGFNTYSDFVFTIVDILVVQRTARQWLAKRKTNALRREKAAITLQSAWRRKKAHMNLLYSLVSIIIVQSVARRFLVKKELQTRRKIRQKSEMLKRNKDLAATAIQKSWRGFWGFSHFIIVKYEVTRIQAVMRGKIARDEFNLKLGCAILIQAVARRFFARKIVAARVASKTVDRAVFASKAIELRERNSAKRIQFWWRIVMDYMKEKKAALVIERFFIYVKAEVDREIREMENERIMKEKARKKQKALKGNFDHEARLNGGHQKIPEVAKKKSRSKSTQKQRKSQRKSSANESQYESFRDHGLVETSLEREPPPEFLQLAPNFSMVSNITNPSILNQYSKELKSPPRTPNHEEKYKEVKSRSKNKMSTEDYIKKYGGSGLQTAPNSESKSQSQQFFSDGGGGTSKDRKRRSHDGSLTINAQSRNKASAPRRGSAHNDKPMSLSTAGLENLDTRGKVPSTPRSTSRSSTPRAVSRGRREGSSFQLPPVTPTRKKSAAILRAATADTECLTMDNDKMSIPPRPSPQKRHYGTHGRGGNGVVIMNTHTDFVDDNTYQEAHELMLLGDDYGEV